MFKIAKIFQIDDIFFQEKFFVSCQVHIGNGVKTDYIKADAQLLRGELVQGGAVQEQMGREGPRAFRYVRTWKSSFP